MPNPAPEHAIVGFNNRDYIMDDDAPPPVRWLDELVASAASPAAASAAAASSSSSLSQPANASLHTILTSPQIHHPPSYYAGALAVHRVWSGMLITLLASWAFASNYIMAEASSRFKNAMSSKHLCLTIGLGCLSISAVYMLVYTVPNWGR